MVHEFDVRAAAPAGERHAERVEDEACAHVGGKLPADHAPAPDVEHETEEDDALPAAQVGEVRDPELVRAGRFEAPLDEVRRARVRSGWVVRHACCGPSRHGSRLLA